MLRIETYNVFLTNCGLSLSTHTTSSYIYMYDILLHIIHVFIEINIINRYKAVDELADPENKVYRLIK